MGRVEFFGVRHHSPACARFLLETIERLAPDAVLIEGPSEFNDQLDQLDLPHQLPVMIYSWAPLDAAADPTTPAGAARRAAYYPLCDYSPEWVAFRAARQRGVRTEFIDLPWLAFADTARAENRFAEPEPEPDTTPDGEPDAEWREALRAMTEAFGVDRVDLLVDELVEIDPTLDLATFRERMGMVGSLLRRARPDDETVAREAFMAARIRAVACEVDGPVLVVCGAAHVDGLAPLVAAETAEGPSVWQPPADDDRYGIALTPTSYAALDALDGYDAGQPNPGFYDQLHHDRLAGRHDTAERMLLAIAADLRRRRVFVSPADLIAALATARGLASLRGHGHPWRTDLLDGITSALVKDDSGERHPLLAAALTVMRGSKVGELAPGARRPPLVVELTNDLTALGLVPSPTERVESADLTDATGLRRSRLLHSLCALRIPGAKLIRSADHDGIEQWALKWTPTYEGALVMAARHGGNREAAVGAVLLTRAAECRDDPVAAASLVLTAALCGITRLGDQLHRQASATLASTGDLPALGRALDQLIRLYRYDPLLRTSGRTDIGALVATGFDRAVRLVERLGPMPDGPGSDDAVTSFRSAADVLERCAEELRLDAVGWDNALAGVVVDDTQSGAVRGAALGARWLAGSTPDPELAAQARLMADPTDLGEFVAGLLTVAREAALRRPSLVLELDAIIATLPESEYLLALPGLRRAFSGYAPRERAQVARIVLGEQAQHALQEFSEGTDTALTLAAFEAEVAATITRFLGEGALS